MYYKKNVKLDLTSEAGGREHTHKFKDTHIFWP
jgi:hypothetical protein